MLTSACVFASIDFWIIRSYISNKWPNTITSGTAFLWNWRSVKYITTKHVNIQFCVWFEGDNNVCFSFEGDNNVCFSFEGDNNVSLYCSEVNCHWTSPSCRRTMIWNRSKPKSMDRLNGSLPKSKILVCTLWNYVTDFNNISVNYLLFSTDA